MNLEMGDNVLLLWGECCNKLCKLNPTRVLMGHNTNKPDYKLGDVRAFPFLVKSLVRPSQTFIHQTANPDVIHITKKIHIPRALVFTSIGLLKHIEFHSDWFHEHLRVFLLTFKGQGSIPGWIRPPRWSGITLFTSHRADPGSIPGLMLMRLELHICY